MMKKLNFKLIVINESENNEYEKVFKSSQMKSNFPIKDLRLIQTHSFMFDEPCFYLQLNQQSKALEDQGCHTLQCIPLSLMR